MRCPGMLVRMPHDTAAVWNRAALENGGPSARAGDRALAAAVLAHGLVMNGGVAHALESLSAEEVEQACAGFERFGFVALADLFRRGVAEDDEEAELAADAEYWKHMPTDQPLMDRLLADIGAQPNDYAD